MQIMNDEREQRKRLVSVVVADGKEMTLEILYLENWVTRIYF